MTVGGTTVNVNGAIAAIDTGTTAMLMPKTIADQINAAIPGASQVVSVPAGGRGYYIKENCRFLNASFSSLS